MNWTQIGNAIDRPEQLDFTGMRTSQAVFAPDISYHDGVFYIVNTCVSCKGNFVITAKNPAGPWSNPIWLPFEGIDPSIYWEGDKAYIVNNRAPAEPPRYDGHRAIWIQEYDWHARKMVGDSKQLINGGIDISKKPVWIEGPHIFRKDGYYYLTAAEGGTSVNHSQVALCARSHSGGPMCRSRAIRSSRSAISIPLVPIRSPRRATPRSCETQHGDWYATFLGVRPYDGDYYNIGRETFLLPVTWKDGWPIILPKGQAVPFVGTKPQASCEPEHQASMPTSGDFGYVDSFDGSKLAMQWVGVRTPKTPFYRLDHGDLILDRGGRIGDLSKVPSFVGRRQQHHVATMSTTVRFTPDTDGDRAGLVAMQSDANYLFFGITRIAGKPVVALYTADKGKEQLVASAPVAGTGPVTLTIRANGGTMAFDYDGAGGKKTLARDVDARILSTKTAGGFVGTLVGPYAWRK